MRHFIAAFLILVASVAYAGIPMPKLEKQEAIDASMGFCEKPGGALIIHVAHFGILKETEDYALYRYRAYYRDYEDYPFLVVEVREDATPGEMLKDVIKHLWYEGEEIVGAEHLRRFLYFTPCELALGERPSV